MMILCLVVAAIILVAVERAAFAAIPLVLAPLWFT
jgi:hypothetical protein